MINIEHCRQRLRETFVDMTEDKAATLLPPAHRYAGRPYARVVTGPVGHTTAHAMQIRQITTTCGSASAPG